MDMDMDMDMDTGMSSSKPDCLHRHVSHDV